MPDKSAFNDLKRAKEEEYFHKKEQDLIEGIRRRNELANKRGELASVTGIGDENILTALSELGYDRETVRLLYLVPLVQVAWASGSVSPSEREIVLDAASMMTIGSDSKVHRQLTEWLETRPDQEFFDRTLRVIREIMETLPPEKRKSGAHGLVTFCKRVAEASGGILGFGNKISNAESAVIERIAAELERSHQDEANRVVEEGS